MSQNTNQPAKKNSRLVWIVAIIVLFYVAANGSTIGRNLGYLAVALIISGLGYWAIKYFERHKNGTLIGIVILAVLITLGNMTGVFNLAGKSGASFGGGLQFVVLSLICAILAIAIATAAFMYRRNSTQVNKKINTGLDQVEVKLKDAAKKRGITIFDDDNQ